MSISPSVVDGAPVAAPGRGPEVLGILQAAAQVIDEVPGAVHQLGDDQEAELMSILLRLQGRSSQVGAIVAADAVDRGAVTRSDAATTGQWISGRLSGETRLELKTIRAMASVAPTRASTARTPSSPKPYSRDRARWSPRGPP